MATLHVFLFFSLLIKVKIRHYFYRKYLNIHTHSTTMRSGRVFFSGASTAFIVASNRKGNDFLENNSIKKDVARRVCARRAPSTTWRRAAAGRGPPPTTCRPWVFFFSIKMSRSDWTQWKNQWQLTWIVSFLIAFEGDQDVQGRLRGRRRQTEPTGDADRLQQKLQLITKKKQTKQYRIVFQRVL